MRYLFSDFIGHNLKVDSIQDLAERGRSTNVFGIQVGDYNFRPEVRLSGRLLQPEISLALRNEEDE